MCPAWWVILNNLLKYWHISLIRDNIFIIPPYNVTGKFIGLYKIVNGYQSEAIYTCEIFFLSNMWKDGLILYVKWIFFTCET